MLINFLNQNNVAQRSRLCDVRFLPISERMRSRQKSNVGEAPSTAASGTPDRGAERIAAVVRSYFAFTVKPVSFLMQQD